MSAQPIIAGFYPDPSVCLVDGTYYVVNSSFEYLPGLPIHASSDLVTWTPISNALCRPSQIAEHAGDASSGIFAPTIRHHDGRFWIVGTNIIDVMEGRGQFIITSDDPAGHWSDPVFVPRTAGIDPDLHWDDEGVCHLTWLAYSHDLRGIASVPVDPVTGVWLAEPALLWQGTGNVAPEGPHLYRIDGWWYLLLAEGGTERGHTATIARARSLDGVFEPSPTNPLLSHRSTGDPVQNVGHADLVQLADGSWAAVHLGVRPRGRGHGFHVNGRETFLVGIDWVDGWPLVDETRFVAAAVDHAFVDRFDGPNLDLRWLGVGRFPTSFSHLLPGGGLRIDADITGSAHSMVVARAQDDEWIAEAVFDATEGSGRFLVRIDDKHTYALRYDGSTVEATLTIGPVTHCVGTVGVTDGMCPTLRISVGLPRSGHPFGTDEPDLIGLTVVDSELGEYRVGDFDGRYLSTEVAAGFTGRVFGVEALSGQIKVRSMSYTPSEAEVVGQLRIVT